MSGGGPAVCGTLVVLGQSVVRIVSRVSGWLLASRAPRWAQTNSLGLSSGVHT